MNEEICFLRGSYQAQNYTLIKGKTATFNSNACNFNSNLINI